MKTPSLRFRKFKRVACGPSLHPSSMTAMGRNWQPEDVRAKMRVASSLSCLDMVFSPFSLIHGALRSRAFVIIEGRVSARLPLPSGERERMGVKRNRQGRCGPQAKPRTRPCLFRFRWKEAETPSPFTDGYGAVGRASSDFQFGCTGFPLPRAVSAGHNVIAY